MSDKNIQKTIIKTIYEILIEIDPEANEPNLNQHLHLDLGFTSIELARLVAELDLVLKKDPFARGASITSIQTVSDLVDIYQSTIEENPETNRLSLSQFQQHIIQRRNLQ